MNLETKIYQKQNHTNVGKLFKDSFRDIIGSRFLAKQLAVRDIKAQYRQSYLGILWAFITPLTTAFVWIFLNATGTIQLTDTGIPYPVYAFSGTLLWSILKDAINSPTSSTNGAKGIMSKINFPKEALIISGVYKMLFNSSIKIILLIVFIFSFGIGYHNSLLLFPLAILGVILIGTTLGLFLTPIAMLYKDIGKIKIPCRKEESYDTFTICSGNCNNNSNGWNCYGIFCSVLLFLLESQTENCYDRKKYA